MMRQRARSAAVFVPLLLLALAIGRPAVVAVVAIGVLLGALETYRLLAAAGYPALPVLGPVVALALVADAALPAELGAGGPLLVGISLVVLALAAFARPDPRDGLEAWIATLFGALYVAQLGFVIGLMDRAGTLPGDAPLAALGAERAWLLLLVLAVWAYDTGAYLVGRQIGGPRFLTHLSPSKTYAGLVGGIVACTIVSGLVLWGIGARPLGALLVGPLLGAAAQAGDLAESMLKRAAGAKDSGTLIPGHGGVLDRIDSFLFAAPVLALYVTLAIR